MTYRYDSRLSFASTLPASYYNDASVLAAEKRNIFGRTWQLVGRAEQVREPGQFFTAVVADEPLLIVRGNDGELRALSNVCRHRAGPVAKGEGKRPVLQCGNEILLILQMCGSFRCAIRESCIIRKRLVVKLKAWVRIAGHRVVPAA